MSSSRIVGTLNQDSCDIADMIDRRSPDDFGGYCTSLKCCEYKDQHGRYRVKNRVLKRHGTFNQDCPDCKSSLLIRRKKDRNEKLE